MAKRKAQIRIGISGWTYPPWRGVFFPKKWPQKRELEWAARQVSSIEINGTFYSLQRPESFRAWHAAAPDDFLFSVKGPRFLTHMKRLNDIEVPLANFLASGVLLLREKLGPILWQFPPHLRFDPEKFESFFRLLPHSTTEAAEMARRHDDHVKGRSWTKTDADRPLRHACEIRHESFECVEFIRMLRKHRIAAVVADTAGKWPLFHDVTSDFVYVRLHGDEELYVSGYTRKALELWQGRVEAWAGGSQAPKARLIDPEHALAKKGRDVFVYFDNDVKVRAPFDAMSLAHRLGLGPAPDEGPPAGTVAEEPRTQWTPVRGGSGIKAER